MELEKTIDNGESEVQVATLGKIVGSDIDGNPIEQNFTEEALKKIADNQTEEILVDADHESEKNGKTEAKGWLSSLKFVDGKGLFGKIRWTNIGKSLIENRVFRWLSPSWLLNDKMEPEYMTSCALTNKPAQIGKIQPIVNAAPIENKFETQTENEETEMTKDEIIALIKETVAEIQKADLKKEDAVEVDKEIDKQDLEIDKKIVEAENEAPAEEKPAEEAPAEEKPAENAAPEEVPAEEKKEETKKEEVIKVEALNSAPTVGIDICKPTAEWKALSGKALSKWIAEHPAEVAELCKS